MKKKFLLILLLLVILTGCSLKKDKKKKEDDYDMYAMPEDAYINTNNLSFDVFSNHMSSELVSDTNVEILDNETLNTDIIGDQVYTINYKFDNKVYKYDVNYKVEDHVNPIFISVPYSITVPLNDDVNLCQKIAYGDNYDDIPNCYVEGEFDLGTVGSYNLNFVITDKSLNENKMDFVLNVVTEMKQTPSKPSIPNYIYMNQILPYKNENTSIGIDISRWQGDIDFNKVKNQGIEFVIIRMGYQKNAFDEYEKDTKFDEYYKQAKEAGLKVSVYVYTNASSDEGAIKAANWIINNLNGDKMDLPIAFDWEDWSDFNSYGVSLHTLSHSYLAFEKTLKENGYEAMLYSSKFYLENVWMDYENSNIWLAHYVSETNYQGNFMLWQMTSQAKIDGISDNTVDIDILYKEKKN